MIAVVLVLVALLAIAAVLYARRVSTGRARGRYSGGTIPPIDPAVLRGEPPIGFVQLPYALPADSPVVRQLLADVEHEAIAKARRGGHFTAGLDPAVIGRGFTDPTPAAGRHRRPDGELPPGAISATSIFRAVKAEADQLPPLPSPTRDQLRRQLTDDQE